MFEVSGEDNLLEGPDVVDQERTALPLVCDLALIRPAHDALELLFLQNRIGFLDEVIDADKTTSSFISSKRSPLITPRPLLLGNQLDRGNDLVSGLGDPFGRRLSICSSLHG